MWSSYGSRTACLGDRFNLSDADRKIKLGMFVVSESDAAAIRAAWEQGWRAGGGGVHDNAHAAVCAATIAGWKPIKLPDAG
jgi:hypothetical protein